MAKLIMDGQEKELSDDSPVKDACEELGVVFGCEDGICGTCMTEVLEGKDNLSEVTQAEKDMGVENNYRLMCQCKVKKGTVTIKY